MKYFDYLVFVTCRDWRNEQGEWVLLHKTLCTNSTWFREAADTKVADLRTMVGERYRDLLSAADSIVRMREASEKLVDGLTRVGNSVAITSARGQKYFQIYNFRNWVLRHRYTVKTSQDCSSKTITRQATRIDSRISCNSLSHNSSSFISTLSRSHSFGILLLSHCRKIRRRGKSDL